MLICDKDHQNTHERLHCMSANGFREVKTDMFRITHIVTVLILLTAINPVDKNSILTGHRGLFCATVFPYIADRKIIRRNQDFFSVPKGAQATPSHELKLFEFREVFISVDPKGNVKYDGTGVHKVMQFRIINQAVYAKAMTSITVRLLSDLGS